MTDVEWVELAQKISKHMSQYDEYWDGENEDTILYVPRGYIKKENINDMVCK
jgi:hypothetical protein